MVETVVAVQNNQLAREIDALRRAKDDRERELEADNAAMRREAEGLRGELESILRELQAIMDSKMGLELEIAAYRKLLEGEETRFVISQIRELTPPRLLHHILSISTRPPVAPVLHKWQPRAYKVNWTWEQYDTIRYQCLTGANKLRVPESD